MKGNIFRSGSMSLCIGALAAVLTLSSCTGKEKLAREVKGTWSSAPEQIQNTGASQTTMVRVIDFAPAADSAEGTLTMTALITVDNVLPSSDKIDTPLTITASGAATVNGVYQAKDDDDIIINLDYSTLQVSIDPQAVQLNYNILTDNDTSALETLRPGAMQLATKQIEQCARIVFANINEIEDIRIHNDLMSCEMGHKDLSFRRQMTR